MTTFQIYMGILLIITTAVLILWTYLHRQNRIDVVIQFKPFKSYEIDLNMFQNLLTLLLNNKDQFAYGLCGFIYYLTFNKSNNRWTIDKYTVLNEEYLKLIYHYFNLTATDDMRYTCIGYWWPVSQIQPRIDWLEECIELIKKQSK